MEEGSEKKTEKNELVKVEKKEIVKVEKKDDMLQPANKKGRHVNGMLNFLRVLIIPFIWLLFPFRIYGKRKVADGSCIYVGNHYRIWDVAYPACTTSEGIRYVAKAELQHTFISPFAKKMKLIYVDRNGEDVRGLMNLLKCLKNGEKVAIYPEGTRNKTKEEMLPFYDGAAMLAIKTKTPIVPVLIYKKTMPFRMNHIIVGEPFEMSEYYGQRLTKEVLAEANEKLRQKLLDMRKEHTEMLESKKHKKR
jgi:1-acyl-sn-glycerol-3-phosphate acyltransferase